MEYGLAEEMNSGKQREIHCSEERSLV